MSTISEILKSSSLDIRKRDKITCIYKITSPNDKIYIGSTVNLYQRINAYCGKFKVNTMGQPKLYNSFKKYGIENHKFEILEKISSIFEIDNKEIEYINLYNSIESGLNILEGGRANYNPLKKTKTIKEKRVSSRKGIKLSNEFKQKVSIGLKSLNLKRSDKHIQAIINANRDKKVIQQIDFNGNLIKEAYRYQFEQEGINTDRIRKCLKNKQKTSQGFIWKYKENEN
jgi:group I intron endonuclease